jgi:hypothetical protein
VSDLVERAELNAAHSRIRLLEAQLRTCQQDAAEAHQSADRWQRLAVLRARVIGQLRQQLERQGVAHA